MPASRGPPAAAGNAVATQRRHRCRRLTAIATVGANDSVPAVAPTPSSARHLAGGNPRVKQVLSSPASSLIHPVRTGLAKTKSPSELPPGGWSGAMSLPTASRSLFLSGGHRGAPGRWRPHAHELLLQMLQPRRSWQPTPGAAPVQLLAWHSHRMGLTPWHGWTQGCHCWSPNMEPLPLACSSKCHVRLLAAAFGGKSCFIT